MAVQSDAILRSPFADVLVEGVFTGPSGRRLTMPAFYDGDGSGGCVSIPVRSALALRTRTRPHNNDLTRWDLRRHGCGIPRLPAGDAGRGLGFPIRVGDAGLPPGDTVYDLFGMAQLRRRSEPSCGGARSRASTSSARVPVVASIRRRHIANGRAGAPGRGVAAKPRRASTSSTSTISGPSTARSNSSRISGSASS